MEIPLPELGLRVIILAGRRDSSRYPQRCVVGGQHAQIAAVATSSGCASGMPRTSRLRQRWAHLGWIGSQRRAGGNRGKSARGGSVTTGGGGTSGAPGSNGSTAPASPTPSTATGSTAPASPTSSTLPTYNQGTVSPTAKPTRTASGVISLGNIGSPTVDSRHPNGSAGHMIPYSGTSTAHTASLSITRTCPRRSRS